MKNHTLNMFCLISIILVSFLMLFHVGETKLEQVVSLVRHGARWHLNSLADGNETFQKWGQLTSVGMRQHQNLGKQLAKEYIQKLAFIDSQLNFSQIELYSTRVNRTIDSAISNFYGLFPPGQSEYMPYVQRKYHLPPFTNKTDLEQQNFPLPEGHQLASAHFDTDIMIDNCPKLPNLIAENVKRLNSQYQEMNLTYYPFLKKTAEIFNISDQMDFQLASNLFDTLNVDKFSNRPIDERFTAADFDNLEHIYNWYNNVKYSGTLAKLISTGKYHKLIKEFDRRVSNASSTLRWTFLSGHDTDIIPAQVDMNISSFECIEELYRKGKTDALNCQNQVGFASSLIFQLHSDPDHPKDLYVMVRSQGKYMNLCQKQSPKCSYKEFKERIKRSILTNISQLCGISSHRSGQKLPDFYLSSLS